LRPQPINQFRQRAEKLRPIRDRRREILLSALADDRELYSVSAAQLLALEGDSGVRVARWLLEGLEREGLVTSRFARHDARGRARKYFRLKPPGS